MFAVVSKQLLYSVLASVCKLQEFELPVHSQGEVSCFMTQLATTKNRGSGFIVVLE